MVLPLAIGAGLGLAGLGMNMYGARKRERAMEGAADREQQLADMQAAANERFTQQDQMQYGQLAGQRRQALSGMLGQYMGPAQAAASAQVQGDPRFAMENVQGDGGVGAQWANAARTRVGRGLGLQQAVSGHENLRAAERLQRAQAMGGFQQSGDVLNRQGMEYADLAALRRQAFENEMIRQRGGLAQQQMQAGQAGSEQMLYGGLLGLGGQAAMSFAPMEGRERMLANSGVESPYPPTNQYSFRGYPSR